MGKKQQQEYVVKKILDRKDEFNSNGTKKTFYKVLWQGYDQSEATWQNSRNLYRDSQVKKEIKKFNETYQKIKKSIALKTKELNAPKKEIFQKQSQSPTKNQTIKKTILLKDAIKSIKGNQSKKLAPEKFNKKAKNSHLSENVNTQNFNVAEKIIEKMRQNIVNEKKQGDVQFDQKQKKLASKMKQKIKSMTKDRKATAKVSKTKTSKTDLRKSETSKSLQEKLGEQKLKPILVDFKLPTITQTSRNEYCLDNSSVTQVLDHIIEQKYLIGKHPLDKTADQKGASNDYIKLELADELNQHQNTNLNFKNKSNTNDQSPIHQPEEQFDIKGMIMCKSEYFYLVEENGKSQILSRAEILNAHPYELICFYERRINIRPAEINMMVI